MRQQLFGVRVGTDGNAALDVNPQAAGLTDYNGWGSSWDRGMLITHYGSGYDGGLGDSVGLITKATCCAVITTFLTEFMLTNYEYDALNRLRKDTGWGNSNYVQAFDYDHFGNRTINQSLTTTSADINKKNFSRSTTNAYRITTSGSAQMAAMNEAGIVARCGCFITAMTGWERKHPACRLPAERGKRPWREVTLKIK